MCDPAVRVQFCVSGQHDGDWLGGLREPGFLVGTERRLAFAREAGSGLEGEHAEADEVVGEEDGEEEDEENEDTVEGGAAEGIGYREREVLWVCWLVVARCLGGRVEGLTCCEDDGQ